MTNTTESHPMNDKAKIAALRAALQFFIDRCDTGMAQSKTTYAKFKDVLALTADASEQAPVADTGAVEHARFVDWMNSFHPEARQHLTAWNGWEGRAQQSAPDTPTATADSAADARAQRLLDAAKVYAFNYCQDEAEDEEDCVCGAKQHAEAKELFAAIAAMQPTTGEGT